MRRAERGAKGRRALVEAGGFTLADFVSHDPPMERCLYLARAAARTDLPVLILGESGTGKTVLARAIHNSSARAARPFATFNAAALSDTLLDSQLFGHERGAFTGADHRVRGKFEQADGGTLFIDEIGDLPVAGQAKILRAVEVGEFEPLGSEVLRAADVRLICATHHSLKALTGDGTFRQDLFQRVSGLTLTLPPLRERPRDLPLLLASQLGAASRREGKPIAGIERAAVDRLLAYGWPGNLRELARVVQVAVLLAPGDTVREEDLLLDAKDPPTGAAKVSSERDEDLSLAAAERRHVLAVLERAGGNKRRTARLLAISRSTLERKLSAARRER